MQELQILQFYQIIRYYLQNIHMHGLHLMLLVRIVMKLGRHFGLAQDLDYFIQFLPSLVFHLVDVEELKLELVIQNLLIK